MGLLGNVKDEWNKQKDKEAEKDLDKALKLLEKYGLNLDAYSAQDIKNKNSDNLKRLTSDLFDAKLSKTVSTLTFAKLEDQAKIRYLSALVEQNWVIIRQNEVMLRLLSKLTK